MTTITINEVGMRDGLQSLQTIMPTAAKRRWIDAAYAAGVRHMEVASFVPARLLPQMADAREVVAHALTYQDLQVTVLAPNLRGARDALESGAQRIVAPVSASLAHSLANVRRTPLEMVEELGRMCELRTEMGLRDGMPRWPAWAAARSPRALPATPLPKTWCSCCRAWATTLASTCLH